MHQLVSVNRDLKRGFSIDRGCDTSDEPENLRSSYSNEVSLSFVPPQDAEKPAFRNGERAFVCLYVLMAQRKVFLC